MYYLLEHGRTVKGTHLDKLFSGEKNHLEQSRHPGGRIHFAGMMERVLSKECKATRAFVLAVSVLSPFLGALAALADVAPDPRNSMARVRVGDSDLRLTPELLLLCAVASLVLLAVALLLRAALRAALRWAGEADAAVGASEKAIPAIESQGTQMPESAPSLARGKKRGWRKPVVVVTAVVFLIGFGRLVVAAVQDFLHFRLKAKTSEATSNLGAIRSTEVAYFAEWGVYVGNQPATPPVDPRTPQRWRHWNPDTRFSIIGFAPAGGVSFGYSLEGPDFSSEGFTARAEADQDGDGKLAIWTVNSASTKVVHSGDDY